MQANIVVVVRVKRLGGFGGKETWYIQLNLILMLAARKARRPVRRILTREEDMATSGQCHPFLGQWKVGVSADGRLQALGLALFSNGGWSWDLSTAVCERAMTRSDSCYRIAHMRVRRVCACSRHYRHRLQTTDSPVPALLAHFVPKMPPRKVRMRPRGRG